MKKSPHNGSRSGLQRAGRWLITLGTAFLAVGANAASPRVVITPSAGFTILWDGNNGGFSTPDSPAPAPDNAARAASAVAFGSSEYGQGVHTIAHVNDGFYGNSHSWISDFTGTTDLDPFIGVAFGQSVNMNNLAWGRDNGDTAADACGGTCMDRSVGTYTIQYTQVAAPGVDTVDTGDAATGWATLGTVQYLGGTDSGAFTAYLRHRFDISAGGGPVSATAVRLKVSERGICVDELEVNTPPDPIPPISNFLVITPAAGFTAEWDLNDGKLNDPSSPAPVPVNRASLVNGTRAFGSSQLDLGVHFSTNINDGLYGNAHSWISANGIGGNSDPDPFVGLNFGGLIELKRIAWSRDNGDVAGDCCGGTLTDRALGTYTLQVTRVANPGAATPDSGDPTTGWQTVSTFEYKAAGPPFSPSLRHRYDLGLVGGGGIPATGIRLKVSDGSMDIDEIEVNPYIALEQDLTADIILTPQGSYSIAWDGNDGEFYSAMAGARSPAHDGLASRGATAFGSSELGFGIHFITKINDGFYGNSSSWISDRGLGAGSDPDPFVGIAFGRSLNLSTLAWGRDNGDTTEGGCGGTCTDRSIGTYTIQVTQVAAPGLDTADTGDAATGWETVGTVQYAQAAPPGFNPSLRHSFLLAKDAQPISATGVRIKVSDGNLAIDELEVNPSTLVTAPPVSDLLVIQPAAGFGISWDRNDGEHSSPLAGAAAPTNAALATRGATAFASSQVDLGVHFTRNINDGLYGNAHSWIADFLASPPDPNPFCGIALPELMAVRSVAWGRDNGDATEAACGGTCTDRNLGVYTVQFTRVTNPDKTTPETGDASSGWETVGTVEYKAAFASLFNPHLRHRFDISQNNAPLAATGIRLKVPNNQIDIDELEVNPYPSIDENTLLVEPEAGFTIEWDGNNGDYFTTNSPAHAPDNDALASHGTTPFGSSQLDFGVHFISNINDGLYGNTHSWIADFAAANDPAPAIGVSFGHTVPVQTIAWGRDNGDVAGDCCGGTLIDRAAGTYTIQFTEVPNPDNTTAETGDPATGWAAIGRLTYRGAGSAAFRHHLRHEYRVSQNGANINATGIRLAVSSNQIDVDELEVNSRPPLPAPKLSSRQEGNELVISWSGGGVLESADQITGPWSAVPNATNPHRQALTGQRSFYRVKR